MDSKDISYYGCNTDTKKPDARPVIEGPARTEITHQEKPATFYGGGYPNLFFAEQFDGEKNLGEMGPPRFYLPNYELLRMRSWQSFMDSEICQTVIKRFGTWVIGKGLKCQSEPDSEVLSYEGITLNMEEFSKMVEGRFNLFAKSKRASFSNMKSLNKLAREAHKNSIIGGDVLVVLRYVKGAITVQLIDGAHIQSPMYGSETMPSNLPNGNRIVNGIEISPTGEHVRYYVRNSNLKYDTIEARGAKSGLQMAFMVYGLEYRLDSSRGLPLIVAVMETLKKIERYKEALVGSAEERQKIPYAIEHDLQGDGKNPFTRTNVMKAFDAGSSDLPKDINGKQLQQMVTATFNKMFVNLPPGAKLSSLDSKNELYFRDFYSMNIDVVCATVNIPPNVAMSKYDANFSASRAALKDWENTLNVDRADFQEQFYQPIYNFFLEVKILEGRINAPGYLEARMKNNFDVIEAYQRVRFVGANVPHIDPEKEANAERVKLGKEAEHIPLTTSEAATEALNGGDFYSNIKRFSEEMKKLKELGIEKTVPPVNNPKKDPDPDPEP